MKGVFITFEGPEGGGKSTHIRKLGERLQALGRSVLVTREPGGTATGELIRGILQHDRAEEPLAERAEVLLFCASRAQLVERIIRPALTAGSWVLCDRFTDSTLAYQGGGRGFCIDELRRLNRFAVGTLVPDLTLLLDIDTERGFARIAQRNGDHTSEDRIEREARAFHQRLRRAYLTFAEEEPERFVRIDSDRPPPVVAEEIWQTVCRRFGLPPTVSGAGEQCDAC